MASPAPPRWAERLLERALPAGIVGAELRGDLREEYARARARRPTWSADLWYAWEALRLIVHFSWKGDGMSGITRDARQAVRGLRRSPVFTLVATLTIGLGLGANTAIFAVLQAVVLAPLPFEQPDRVVALREVSLETGEGDNAFSFPQYEVFKASQRGFSGLAAWQVHQPILTSDDGRPPQRLRGAVVTHDMLPLLGVAPVLGRGFRSDDDKQGAVPVVLISHAFWLSALGGDQAVLDRSLRLDGIAHGVVGVLSPDFEGETTGAGVLPPATAQVWLPYRTSSLAQGISVGGLHNVNVVGRLGEDITIEAARADVERVMAVVRAGSSSHESDGVKVVVSQDVVVGDVASTMYMLFGAVTLVLLIACTNVANLVLGRATSRRREMALRAALGSGRARLARLMLTESLCLAVLGGLVGVSIAAGGLKVLGALDPGSIPRLAAASVSASTLSFLFCSSLLVGLVLGVVPLLQLRDGGLGSVLRDGGRGLGAGRSRLRKGLVVVQVSAAVVLLMGAGLLTRSLGEVLDVDPGYRPEGLLTARVAMPTPFVSPEWAEHVTFFRDLTEAIENLPGVTMAAAGYWDPADPGWNNGFSFESRPEPEPGRNPSAIFRPVTPGYFETIAAPILRGRGFTPADDSDALGVVIVNEAFVRRYFVDGEALGERLTYGDLWGARPPDYEIIGVVQDVRFTGVVNTPPPAVYFPHAQQPVREMALLARTNGDPNALLPQVRALVASMRPDLPLDFASSLEHKLDLVSSERRFLALTLGMFALTALILAGLGLYGVLSFMVARRTHEIGVRLAVGAHHGRVVSEVVREGLSLVALGLAIGLPVAYATSGVLESLLFGVLLTDTVTAASVLMVLALVGGLACIVPALRATRVDPLVALRAE